MYFVELLDIRINLITKITLGIIVNGTLIVNQFLNSFRE